MSATKWTTGPWTLHTIKPGEAADDKNPNAFRGPLPGDFAIVGNDDTCPGILWGEWSHAEANAALISAAPDLYDALDRILADFRNVIASKPVRCADETIEEVKHALAKARGEGTP